MGGPLVSYTRQHVLSVWIGFRDQAFKKDRWEREMIASSCETVESPELLLLVPSFGICDVCCFHQVKDALRGCRRLVATCCNIISANNQNKALNLHIRVATRELLELLAHKDISTRDGLVQISRDLPPQDENRQDRVYCNRDGMHR